jgi:bis(5'-nucleosidyl)-tetraphosphatase
VHRDGAVFVKDDSSFGIIPLAREEGRGWFTFLVCHRAGHWGFPKGHADAGEEALHAAKRELFEETGLQVAEFLETPPLKERYQFEMKGKRVDKRVTYFLAIAEGEVVLQWDELLDGRWIALSEAEGLLTYPEGKALCREVTQILSKMES